MGRSMATYASKMASGQEEMGAVGPAVVFISGPNRKVTEQLCQRLNTEHDAKYLLDDFHFVPSALGTVPKKAPTVDQTVTSEQWGTRAAVNEDPMLSRRAHVEDLRGLPIDE